MKNKANKKPQQVENQFKKNSFDVKQNLKKLNSDSGRETHSSNYDYLDSENTNSNVVASNSNLSGFEQTTFQEFKHLNNKINSDISSLKDHVHQTKDNIFLKLSNDLSDIKKDYEGKIECKVDNKYFFGAVGVLVVITSLIGTLSYYPLIQDVKDLNEKTNHIDDSIVRANKRIDKILIKK